MSDQQNTQKSAASPFEYFCNHSQFASVQMDSSSVNYHSSTFRSDESRGRDELTWMCTLLGEAIPLVTVSIVGSGSQPSCVEISE